MILSTNAVFILHLKTGFLINWVQAPKNCPHFMFSFQTIFVILLEIGNLILKWEQKKSKFQTKDVDDGVSVC